MISNPQQEELQTLQERAKEYYAIVKADIEAQRQEDKTLIVGLDPREKRYWIGETESEVVQKKENKGNKNLVYFIMLPAKKNDLKDKLLMSSVW